MSPNSDDMVDGVLAAWRRHVGDVTREEVAALLPIIQAGHGRLKGMVLAYRAGQPGADVPAPAAGICPNHYIPGPDGASVATPHAGCPLCAAWMAST